MTLQEKIIATAYTGVFFVQSDEITAFCEYASEKLNKPIYMNTIADREFRGLLRERSRHDFIDMTSETTEEPRQEEDKQ